MTRERFDDAIIAAMNSAGENIMQWGRDDCALWCADIVRKVCGYDPARDFRGHYRSRRGAHKVLGSRGLKGAIERAARRHGWKRIRPDMARIGDIGIARMTQPDGSEAFTTVICRAHGWFVGRSEHGIRRRARASCRRRVVGAA